MNTRSRARQPVSSDDDDDDAPASAWLEPTNATLQSASRADEQSIMSFHMEKKRKSPPQQHQRDEPEPTNSADDDEDEEELELASQRTSTTTAKQAPPISKSPPLKKRVQFAAPLTHTDIRDEQRTRRSNARNTLEALRNNQIPGYDTGVPASERDVIIDPDLFRSLREDSAYEFQDANKPPWAPSVPQAILNKVRDWEVLETLSELDKRRNDWYQLALKVAGALQLPVDAIIVMGPNTASTQAVRPSRTLGSELATPPANAGTTRDVGLASVGESLAGLTATTPLRDAAMQSPRGGGGGERAVGAGFERYRQRRERDAPLGAPAPPPGPTGPDPTSHLFPIARGNKLEPPEVTQMGPEPTFQLRGFQTAPSSPVQLPQQQQQRPPPTPAPPPPRPSTVPGEPLLSAQTEGQIDDALLFATQNALGGVELARSGARFADVRKAKHVPAEWYERDPRQQAYEINATVRGAGARARSWIGRPLATGVFFFNQNYLSARNKAYTQITSRADHLANVSMHYFARPGRSGTVQFRVFDSFGELIAEMYRLARHNSNTSAKLASDAVNIAGAIEELTRLFVTRITFDARTCQFRDTGVTAALTTYPAWDRRHFTNRAPSAQQRVSELITAYGLDSTRTNPLLLTTHPSVDPRYVPGTLIGAMHQ